MNTDECGYQPAAAWYFSFFVGYSSPYADIANMGGLAGCTPANHTSFSCAASPPQTPPLRKVSNKSVYNPVIIDANIESLFRHIINHEHIGEHIELA